MPSKATRTKRSHTLSKEEKDIEDRFDGELKNRRYGIRIDDDIEVTIIAGNDILKVRGRLLSMRDEIELVDEDGHYNQLMADWVVAIKVIGHNRPLPEKDQELIKKPTRTKPKRTSVDHAYN